MRHCGRRYSSCSQTASSRTPRSICSSRPMDERLVGNIFGWSQKSAPLDSLTDLAVMRNGRPSLSRLLPRLLPDGSILVVGRDLQDQREIERLVWHALLAGGAAALLLAIGGALLFRRQIEHRVGAIRRTALEIEAGDLSRRIPISDVEDEFARLNRDINRMLDRIEHLMDGVRHVSNAIAHDLRTPLGRIRSRLEEALQPRRQHGATRRHGTFCHSASRRADPDARQAAADRRSRIGGPSAILRARTARLRGRATSSNSTTPPRRRKESPSSARSRVGQWRSATRTSLRARSRT